MKKNILLLLILLSSLSCKKPAKIYGAWRTVTLTAGNGSFNSMTFNFDAHGTFTSKVLRPDMNVIFNGNYTLSKDSIYLNFTQYGKEEDTRMTDTSYQRVFFVEKLERNKLIFSLGTFRADMIRD